MIYNNVTERIITVIFCMHGVQYSAGKLLLLLRTNSLAVLLGLPVLQSID